MSGDWTPSAWEAERHPQAADPEPAGRKGHRPWPGEPQPFHPVPGRSQAGGGGGFVDVNGRLFAPLQGVAPNDPAQGGYTWLSVTDHGMTLHPGIDLNSGGSCNADMGALVVAPLAGVVRAVLYAASGEGNHVWVELDDPCCPGPTFWHTDHLQSVVVSVGQRLAPGEAIGGCGATGGWDCAHAHVELTKGPPSTGFWQWPYGWSRAQVEAAYYRPLDWWNAATALVLAESHQPIPAEEFMILTGAQQAAVQAALWGQHPFHPDHAIPTAWRQEWIAGAYRGRPLSSEQEIPASEDKPTGRFMVFEAGIACWLPGEPVSWTG